MHADIEKVLLSESAIAARVKELGAEITEGLVELSREADGREIGITLVPILTGSIIFVADLVRRLPIKIHIEAMTISSYPGTATRSQGASVVGSIPSGLAGRHVVVVDDILDSGRTLRLVRQEIAAQNPASVRTCVLLRKTIPPAMETPCEHIGFDIPDVFVVGYGLDYDDHYRNLPYVGTLRREAM